MNEPQKRTLKIIGWVYVAYAVIMLLGHVPTLLRELMGGYSHIEFSIVDPSFDLVEKSWFFGDKKTWEYRFFKNTDGLFQWHCRLKYVNGSPYKSRYPTDSPWQPSEIHDSKIRILER
jgi:hypothetical protein